MGTFQQLYTRGHAAGQYAGVEFCLGLSEPGQTLDDDTVEECAEAYAVGLRGIERRAFVHGFILGYESVVYDGPRGDPSHYDGPDFSK